jgi:outer membrane protein
MKKRLKTSYLGYLMGMMSLGLLGTPAEAATNLWQTFQIASQNNAGIHADQKVKNAGVETYLSSLSGLFPQLSANATWIKDYHSGGVSGSYQTESYGASASQILFNPQAWMTNISNYHTSRSVSANYDYQYQQFIQLVVQDYFAVLKAKDILNVDLANVDHLKTAYDQALVQYKVGIAVEAAVKQAEAQYKQALATQIQDQNSLQSAKQSLQAVTNQPVGDLLALQKNLVFSFPEPVNVGSWISLGLASNKNLISATQNTAASRAAFESDVGAWMPSVSLLLSVTDANPRTYGNSYLISSLRVNHSIDRKIAFAFTWDLFGGANGANPYSIEEGANIYASAQDTQLQTRRNIQTLVKQDFNNVKADLQNIAQYQAAVAASQASLDQYEARFKVGLSTMLEVLQQVDTLYQAQSDYLQSQYNFINDQIQLKLDAGVLSDKDVQLLNQLLD